MSYVLPSDPDEREKERREARERYLASRRAQGLPDELPVEVINRAADYLADIPLKRKP